jgi:hypothetical protein
VDIALETGRADALNTSSFAELIFVPLALVFYGEPIDNTVSQGSILVAMWRSGTNNTRATQVSGANPNDLNNPKLD